ncbi:hypothetical protein BIW11_13519, partial [Tropilaelaps mercedesae]
MSAEGSSATGNLSREAPARRGHPGGSRGGYHQDYNAGRTSAPSEPGHRGHNAVYLKPSRGPSSFQARDMDHRYRDGRHEREDHGRNHQGRYWRDNKDTTNRLAANFVRNPVQWRPAVQQRPRVIRERLFEDYVRQNQQLEHQQRLKQYPRRQVPPGQRDNEEQVATSVGVSRNGRASRVDRGAVAAERNSGVVERAAEQPPPESGPSQPMSKLNVFAQEFTPSA